MIVEVILKIFYSEFQNLTLRSVESSVIEFSEQGERPSDP